MFAKGNVFQMGDEAPCDYYDDGRPMRLAYSAYRPATPMWSQNREKCLDYKFQLMREGFLSETFSACSTLCPSCRACVPLRVNLSVPDTKTQQRMSCEADDLYITSHRPGDLNPKEMVQLYNLFIKYASTRHPKSKMLDFEPKNLIKIFMARTDLITIHDRPYPGELVAFACVDRYKKEGSLDHVIYNPEANYKNISLGHLAWIKAVQWLRGEKATHMYIGSVNDGPKLQYKASRNPAALEAFSSDGEWVAYDAEKHRLGPDYASRLTQMGQLTAERL